MVKSYLQNLQRYLSDKFVYIIAIYVIVQLVYAIWGQLPFTSDSLRYYENAVECIKHNSFYPGKHNLYDPYINSPLYVNLLIVVLTIFNSPKIIPFVNIILNLLNLFLIYKVTGRVYENKAYAKTAALIYMIYLTNLGAVILNLSEFLFCFFMLGAYYFYFGKKKHEFILSGILIALSLNTRPVGMLILISFLVIYIFEIFRKQGSHLKFILVLSGFAVTFVTMGTMAKIESGNFVVGSTTNAINILIGANDEATGGYTNKPFKKGKIGYIENEEDKTYMEKSDIWESAAFSWIKEHPFKWVSLFPAKIFHLFAFDDWSINTIVNTTDWNIYNVVKSFIRKSNEEENFNNEALNFKISFITLYTVHHLIYYYIVYLIMFQFYSFVRKFHKINLQILAIYLFSIMGIFATLIAFGAFRYKYLYLILLIITIAPALYDRVKLQKL